MTGRRLYDLYCDATAQHNSTTGYTAGVWTHADPLPAWPFLPTKERAMWSAMAGRVTGVRR